MTKMISLADEIYVKLEKEKREGQSFGGTILELIADRKKLQSYLDGEVKGEKGE